MSAKALKVAGAMSVIYPIYVVIDSSKSMNKEYKGRRRIDYALDIPKALLKAYEARPTLIHAVQISVIVFNTSADTILELGEISKLRNLPEVEARSKTYYGKAFEELYLRISQDSSRLSRSNVFMKPAVLFITDGRPNDPMSERQESFSKLVPIGDKNVAKSVDLKKFPQSPRIMMFGIDIVDLEILKGYASRDNLAFHTDLTASMDAQMEAISTYLVKTVGASMANNPPTSPDQEWWSELIQFMDGDDDDDDDYFVLADKS